MAPNSGPAREPWELFRLPSLVLPPLGYSPAIAVVPGQRRVAVCWCVPSPRWPIFSQLKRLLGHGVCLQAQKRCRVPPGSTLRLGFLQPASEGCSQIPHWYQSWSISDVPSGKGKSRLRAVQARELGWPWSLQDDCLSLNPYFTQASLIEKRSTA